MSLVLVTFIINSFTEYVYDQSINNLVFNVSTIKCKSKIPRTHATFLKPPTTQSCHRRWRNDQENQNIFTFEKLEPVNVSFKKNYLNDHFDN